MSEVSKMKEWFDFQTMSNLAAYVAKKIPKESRVAVGIAEFYGCASPSDLALLDEPTTIVASSDGSAISEADRELLVESITGAAGTIIAGQEVDYPISDYPVLSYGIESDEEYIGVLFVAVLTLPTDPDSIDQSELVEDIEGEICELFAVEDAEYGPENDPYTAWYYGTLFGDIVFNTQE